MYPSDSGNFLIAAVLSLLLMIAFMVAGVAYAWYLVLRWFWS